MSPHADKEHILLDTCIVEYWLNKDIQPALSDFFSKIPSVFDLAISEISYAELIDGAHTDKVRIVKETLEKYTRFEVTQRILSGAGILSTVYKANSERKNGAGLQDKIIAATSFVYNLPLITADIFDYPHPFFTTIQSENLRYSKKGRDHFITVDILKPNLQILNYWYTRIK